MGIASFAISAVSSVAQYSAQQQEYKRNEKNAVQAWKNDQAQLTLRQMQEDEATAQKQRAQNLQEAEVKSEVEAASAANGVSGISIDNLLQDVGRKAAYNREVEDRNARYIALQIKQQRAGASAQAQSRIDSVPKPSPISLVAGLGSAALGGFQTYQKYSM